MEIIKYRWACPQDWLMEKMDGMDRATILANLKELVSLTDADKLQDVFQNEMERDGYFKPVRESCPVLYVLDPTTGEAEDVLYFCSDACRTVIQENTDRKVAPGVSRDFIEGTVCDECGNEL